MEKEKNSLRKTRAAEMDMPLPSNNTATKAILVLFLLLLAIGFVGYFIKFQKAQKQIDFLSSAEGRQEIDKKELEQIMGQVGKHIVLPENETPTVATVTDAQSLQAEQPFFEKTQNGDKVLVYSNFVYLYRPAEDRIINVGPIYFQENGQAIPQTNAPKEQQIDTRITLDIRNGSQRTGAAQTLADSLPSDLYRVVNLSNAANSDYPQTILVDINGVDLNSLEAQLGVSSLSTLPDGEAGASADALIIIGNE